MSSSQYQICYFWTDCNFNVYCGMLLTNCIPAIILLQKAWSTLWMEYLLIRGSVFLFCLDNEINSYLTVWGKLSPYLMVRYSGAIPFRIFRCTSKVYFCFAVATSSPFRGQLTIRGLPSFFPSDTELYGSAHFFLL